MINQVIQKQLRNDYNPDGSDLRRIQMELLNILVVFDNICNTHNICYWLDSGTLIGAVRHGGFIPWDDDIDVCVLSKDYPRLMKCLEADLSAPFRLYNHLKCNPDDVVNHVTISRVLNTSFVVSRRKDKDGNPIFEPIWIDIFPMENGTLKIKRFVERTYGKMIRRKVCMIHDGENKHLVSVILEPVLRPFLHVFRWFGRIFYKSTYIHDYGINFTSIRQRKDIFPLQKCTFEGYSFSCPHDCHSYLTDIYGDWETLPDIKARMQHNFEFAKKM